MLYQATSDQGGDRTSYTHRLRADLTSELSFDIQQRRLDLEEAEDSELAGS